MNEEGAGHVKGREERGRRRRTERRRCDFQGPKTWRRLPNRICQTHMYPCMSQKLRRKTNSGLTRNGTAGGRKLMLPFLFAWRKKSQKHECFFYLFFGSNQRKPTTHKKVWSKRKEKSAFFLPSSTLGINLNVGKFFFSSSSSLVSSLLIFSLSPTPALIFVRREGKRLDFPLAS